MTSAASDDRARIERASHAWFPIDLPPGRPDLDCGYLGMGMYSGEGGAINDGFEVGFRASVRRPKKSVQAIARRDPPDYQAILDYNDLPEQDAGLNGA